MGKNNAILFVKKLVQLRRRKGRFNHFYVYFFRHKYSWIGKEFAKKNYMKVLWMACKHIKSELSQVHPQNTIWSPQKEAPRWEFFLGASYFFWKLKYWPCVICVPFLPFCIQVYQLLAVIRANATVPIIAPYCKVCFTMHLNTCAIKQTYSNSR